MPDVFSGQYNGQVSIFGDENLSYLTTGQTDNPYTPGHWSQSLIIRLIIGAIVANAITLLFLRLTELILNRIAPNEHFWLSLPGFITWQSMQVVGVFIGGMMAAAGGVSMQTLGMLLGVTVGFLTLLLFPTNPNISPALYFAMPGWFALSGIAGSWLGEKLWHPHYRKSKRILSNTSLTHPHSDQSIAQMIRQAVVGMIFANIHWLRVILAVLMILPTLWYTHDFVNWLISRSGLSVWVMEVGLQKSLVERMLKITVVLLAAAFTGAGTNHGIAHGFWTGVIVSVLNLLLHVFLPKEEVLPVDAILWEVAWVMVLCIVSGGFGALVIPPIMYLAQKRRPANIR